MTTTKGFLIGGPPYAGKTSAAQLLREKFPSLKVLDIDEVMRPLMPDTDLWLGWRGDHPRHEEWKKVWDKTLDTMKNHFNEGGIVITHNPADIANSPDRTVWLAPPADEIYKRATQSTKEGGQEGINRALAALHFSWDRALAMDMPQGRRVSSEEDLIARVKDAYKDELSQPITEAPPPVPEAAHASQAASFIEGVPQEAKHADQLHPAPGGEDFTSAVEKYFKARSSP